MCMPIVENLRRSLFARIPAQVISTTDVAQAQEDVVNFLLGEDHMFTLWSPVLGKSSMAIVNPSQLGMGEYDQGYAGDLHPVLQSWLENMKNGDRTHRLVDDFDETTYHDRSVHCIGEGTPLHNTLVLIGAEIFLSKDSHQYDPLAAHAIWEIMQTNLRELNNLIIITPSDCDLPEKISSSASIIEDGLPTRKEFNDVIWPAFSQGCPPSLMTPLGDLLTLAPLVVDRLCGLARPAARNTLTTSIIHAAHSNLSHGEEYREFFLAKLAKSKELELRKSSALEIMRATPMEKIGGLDKYKSWIEPRRLAFSEEARMAGIPRPKGVLLVGPPGTGKTEVAKATAATLGVPLIRADLGAIYGGIVGASEANMRNMLKTLEAAAPCVVLFDEIEKALSGSSGPSTDSGTSQRVFGTLLSWMQDRDQENMIFIVATSNDVSSLPPEFLRKGRFDELFFVDLPNEEERRAILDIHLEPVRAFFDVRYWDMLVKATDGVVGAEIEQSVVESRINAFAAGRDWCTMDLLEALQELKPLSVTMAEKIGKVRAWATTRARPASSAASTHVGTVGEKRAGGMSFKGLG